MLHDWEKYQDSHQTLWFRADAATDQNVAVVSKWNSEEFWTCVVSDVWSYEAASPEAGMNRCDAKLRSMGLLDEE